MFHLQLRLDEAGCCVVVEPIYQRCRTTVAQLKPDLLVLDLLPEMDLDQLMGGQKWTTPTLVLASRMDQRRAVHSLDLGAEDCLYKPLDLDEVVRRIQALLHQPLETQDQTRKVRSGWPRAESGSHPLK